MESQDLAGNRGRFELPPEVSFCKQRLGDAWAYVFRHRTLGELGRILLQDNRDGHCRISCEVVGDPADPMTEAAPPPRPSGARDIIESRLIPCDHCGTPVALLIFAPEATDLGHFEDCARKMYPECRRLNVPTWIIGPALGDGPEMDRPADILRVWPTRGPIQRFHPAEFNPII